MSPLPRRYKGMASLEHARYTDDFNGTFVPAKKRCSFMNVSVQQTDGKFCFCPDSLKLSTATIRNAYSILEKDDIISSFGAVMSFQH